jgi:hypothetical protein
MRKKVSTIMEASLFRRAKLEAARQGRPLSAVIEEALEAHLAATAGPKRTGGSLVDASWGVFPLPPEVVREIMEDEDDWLET